MTIGIETAIREKIKIEFDYNGYHRIAEPHVYGQTNGKQQILVYQTHGGSSSGRLPNWRLVDLRKISNLILSNVHFPGRRPYPSGKHSSFDKIYTIVA